MKKQKSLQKGNWMAEEKMHQFNKNDTASNIFPKGTLARGIVFRNI